MSLYIRKRIMNTLKRLKFKAENKDSHIYGYFPPVKSYKTRDYSTYEIEKFKIVQYKNGDVIFYYNHHIQAVIKKFLRISLIASVDSLNKIINECDDLTNNDTK